jgi:DNA damage-binding protein 1
MASIISAFDGSGVADSLICQFTSPSVHNLILNKVTHLEVYNFSGEGESPILQERIPINGKISLFQSLRAGTSDTDLLLLTTEKYDFCILKYNSLSNNTKKQPQTSITTVASGNLNKICGKQNDLGQMGGIDQSHRAFIMHFLQGIIKIIPIAKAASNNDILFKESFDVRIQELNIISLSILHDKPLLFGIIWQDVHRRRHFKTYQVNLAKECVEDANCSFVECDVTAKLLLAVPKPLGGALIIGEHSILYKSSNSSVIFPFQATFCFQAATLIPSSAGLRWLLGDSEGKLFLLCLVLDFKKEQVVALEMEFLACTSVITSCISYIDNGVIFLGSVFGDSQLVRLLNERDASGNMIEYLNSYTGLAPIQDFHLVEEGSSFCKSILACCGSRIQGSIRTIRLGTAIQREHVLDIRGMAFKRIWALKTSNKHSAHSHLLFSSVGTSRLFFLNDEEVEEVEICGFSPEQEETFFATNLINQDLILHVTNKFIRLLYCFANKFVIKRSWECPTSKIIQCDYFNDFVVVASIDQVYLFECSANATLSAVSCISLVNVQSEISAVSYSSLGLLIAYWEKGGAIDIYRGETLFITLKIPLNNLNVVCKSIQVIEAENGNFWLFFGFTDGKVFMAKFSNALENCQSFTLGNRPVNIKRLSSTRLIACCDSPVIIWLEMGEIKMEKVNLPQLVDASPISTPLFPECSLCTIDWNSLSFGRLEPSTFCISAWHLGKTPRKMAYSENSKLFAVLDVDFDSVYSFKGSNVVLYDAISMEQCCIFPLDEGEEGTALSLIRLTVEAGKTELFFAVGTAFVSAEASDIVKGRIKLLRIASLGKKLELAYELEVLGAVNYISPFKPDVFAATYGKSVGVFGLEKHVENSAFVLTELSSRKSYVEAMIVKSKGDFLAVSDILKPMNVLRYISKDKSLEERSRDYNINTLIALDFFGDESILGADSYGNLMLFDLHPEETAEIQRRKLEISGFFHLGDRISSFSRVDSSKCGNVYYSTVTGSIGCISPLEQPEFDLLSQQEEKELSGRNFIGRIAYDKFRAFQNDRRTAPRAQFVDRNLLNEYSNSNDNFL